MATLKPLIVIGLNSGTSMDGIDAAIFRIIPLGSAGKSNGHSALQNLDVEMLDAVVHPLPTLLVRKMQSIIRSGQATLEDTIRLHVALGEVFATAAIAIMKRCNLTRTEVDLIGSHGQTMWHAPAMRKFAGIPTHGTMQLGDASIIAARTGVPVISDFRARDMAKGGQGAPLVAFADEVLFGAEEGPTAVLNIGGIANITILDRHGEAAMAFDTGPGNLLIDRLAYKLFQKSFDEGGELAAAGRVDEQWLQELLKHKYFAEQPPKTTGRELFGASVADELITESESRGLSAKDAIATVTALTAASIAASYERFILSDYKVNTLILGGGGADNKTLCEQLSKRWPHAIKIKRHEDYGISTKFKEALLFALLAYTTHFGIANNVPRCTGASQRVCLGTITRG
jgi:anhydro-N-acetylmuramic acid kinase